MAWLRFVICLFGGFFGIHKFMEKKIGLGFCTCLQLDCVESDDCTIAASIYLRQSGRPVTEPKFR